MISRKDANKWFDIVTVNLDNIARAKSSDNLFVLIEHGIHLGNGKEFICFRVKWKGGPRGCIRTNEDIDREVERIASSLPVQCWFGKPDEVERCKFLPHTFDAYVYIK